MDNTIILLIDFEGLKGLQDQNYLKNRYNALMDILQQRSIDREKCIVVFNTYNVDTKINKIEDEQLREVCKFAWLEKWNVYNTTKETGVGLTDIDIEYFIELMKERRPEFKIDPATTKIVIGGTETAGCCLVNKKLGALHWVKRGYRTTMYLPMMAEYSSIGHDWYTKQQSGFANFWKEICNNPDPMIFKKLSIRSNFNSLTHDLPWTLERIRPL